MKVINDTAIVCYMQKNAYYVKETIISRLLNIWGTQKIWHFIVDRCYANPWLFQSNKKLNAYMTTTKICTPLEIPLWAFLIIWTLTVFPLSPPYRLLFLSISSHLNHTHVQLFREKININSFDQRFRCKWIENEFLLLHLTDTDRN